MKDIDLTNPELFVNRELSLLEFNRRVLEQAKDDATPLLERLRFLCISSRNLDEFFEVRASGIKQQIDLGALTTGPDGLTPHEQLARISTVLPAEIASSQSSSCSRHTVRPGDPSETGHPRVSNLHRMAVSASDCRGPRMNHRVC